jgi:hypothetical protein
MIFFNRLHNYLPNDQQTSLIKNLLAYNDECSFYDKKRQLNLHTREGKGSFWNTFAHYQILIPQIIPTSSWEKTKITKLWRRLLTTVIQNLVNAYLENPPKIQYENVPFPNLPKDKVVGLGWR